MHNIRQRPNRNWQIYFRQQYTATPGSTTGRRLTAILPEGVSLRARGTVGAPKGVVLQDNIEFDVRMHYAGTDRGCSRAHVYFQDNDASLPYIYTFSADELREFFRGLNSGRIPVHPDGFDVRLTFVKKGTQIFAKPIL